MQKLGWCVSQRVALIGDASGAWTQSPGKDCRSDFDKLWLLADALEAGDLSRYQASTVAWLAAQR